jgi:ABC-type dipeptide/oligopeptide/nickel transport system ATPase subunit
MTLLDTVKLPRDFYFRKPRQLSGGHKQRIGIARAFAGNPSIVIAGEPVSALDVSEAAAVTELLMDIQRKHKTTLLFISHDLSFVRYLSDRIVVMYLGHILSGNQQGNTSHLTNVYGFSVDKTRTGPATRGSILIIRNLAGSSVMGFPCIPAKKLRKTLLALTGKT